MIDIEIAGRELSGMFLNVLAIAIAIAIALILHFVTLKIARRMAERTPQSIDDVFVDYASRPALFILVAIALTLVRNYLHLPDWAQTLWIRMAGLILPALVGWLAINMIRAFGRAVELDADISVEDNLRARRRRTRGAILTRIAVLVVGFITVCLMLLSIPGVRSVGVTLMASAGLAALAVGAAAQPALKNLIAGIQMAFTEPIRLDDVVIVEGEWGRIEEIRLTYVVVCVWDERRLVVPVSKFLDESFQNWTRQTSQLLGSAFFYLDPRADIDRLRAKYEEVVKANPRWVN